VTFGLFSKFIPEFYRFFMKKLLAIILATFCLFSCDFERYRLVKEYDLETRFEKSQGKETATYKEVIDFYTQLAEVHPSISIQEFGTTDSGEPLHLVIFNSGKEKDLENLRKNHSVILINNGIHPGESDGIDATMMLFRDMAGDSIAAPKNTILATIPVYNIGGALNRNSATRTNQNGPAEYGFRGNARNYDLNRDFIKADTRNTRAFYEIYHYLQPDVFIDTHVSNGADYQYTLTHLFTQHNKLGGELGEYINEKMMPALEDSLRQKSWDITPYVNVFGDVPEKGFSQFLDHPRYSTGYTTMWNSLGMMVETHMLKDYAKRVLGTYELLRSMVYITDAETPRIKDLRDRARRKYLTERWYPLNFKADMENPSRREFKGFEASVKTSEVTGANRLAYDRNLPFTQQIDYFNNFIAEDRVEIPRAYVIPQGWWNVIELLEQNKITYERFSQDTIIEVERYKIEDYETVESPYEGHYMHRNTQVSMRKDNVKFRKGDYYVRTFQDGARYLIETLEPIAPDSFFNWNFFDTVLQQKEGFSGYVFEDTAAKMLEEDEALRDEFEQKKRSDSEFASNPYAQLQWLHKKSKHYEPAHLSYPIFRIPR
jgi:hypothetical protein